MITQTSYTMDCLNNMLPEELVRRVQTFTSHPICDDEYFKTKKMLLAHEEICQAFRPPEMLDMIISELNHQFLVSVRQERYYMRSKLAKMLNTQDCWMNNFTTSLMIVPQYVRLMFVKLGLMPSDEKATVDYDYALIKVFRFLSDLCENLPKIELRRDCNRWIDACHKRMSWFPIKDAYTKPDLQKLLTENRVEFKKSWNKAKLIQAWCKIDN